ncbi:hypothetical protein [Psychroserpens sp. SPM9]|uniref:hypothetical protein n=1 Tax=Psychroserpens sp. SPM9 TaxID=2975598 RepID=UPI0021A50A33|nr:hypothetical protein [Psychroserpens sp. SPM9]MDG5492025.1 hypothetical protein [Psychroserpens sp. SPM9]
MNYEVTSNEYQTEVAKLIESIGIENLRFWLADYIEKADKHYFIFYTQGHDLCAQMMVQVDAENPNFGELIKTKGKGRFNAEFVGLLVDIVPKNPNQIEFIYKSHKRIID